MSKMNPWLKGILTAAGLFVILLCIHYLVSAIKGTAFDPKWLETALLSVLCGVLSFFGWNRKGTKRNG